jgi:CheY-like chemotaxis protein
LKFQWVASFGQFWHELSCYFGLSSYLVENWEFQVTTLLLVEDNKLLSLMEAKHLSTAFPRLSLSVAKDGPEALASAKRENPSVIVLDCQLPSGNCCTLLSDLLSVSPGSHVIVTSAEPPEDLRGRSYRDKIFDILEKPFETEELVCVVGRALEATGHLETSLDEVEKGENRPSRKTYETRPRALDRHQVLNVLSGILAGLRAFEADLEADCESPSAVRSAAEEYIPRLVDMVGKVTRFIKANGQTW